MYLILHLLVSVSACRQFLWCSIWVVEGERTPCGGEANAGFNDLQQLLLRKETTPSKIFHVHSEFLLNALFCVTLFMSCVEFSLSLFNR
eukprot:gene8417-5897_t